LEDLLARHPDKFAFLFSLDFSPWHSDPPRPKL
jgi:hypothetical protein